MFKVPQLPNCSRQGLKQASLNQEPELLSGEEAGVRLQKRPRIGVPCQGRLECQAGLPCPQSPEVKSVSSKVI